MSTDPTSPTAWSGLPPAPGCDGWHILAEWDDEADLPLTEFVLWWDADRSLWFDRRDDLSAHGETVGKTAEFHRYVRALTEAS